MKIKKLLIKLLAAIIAAVSTNVPAYAVTRSPVYGYNYKFSRGVGNTCYYISSSASAYTSWINNAASLWEYNGYSNPIYMQAVSSDYATHMDFYAKTISEDSNLNSNINAYTTVYDANGNQISFTSSAWFYANIVINKNASPTQATIVHEMGHAFGLDHYPSNAYSIMYNYSSGRQVTSPQECDVAAINYLYS